jgi:YD repeat-containing protein
MTLRVDVATGGTTLDALDLRLPGAIPLALGRRYESARREAGPLGPGWRLGLDVRLEVGAEAVTCRGGGFDGATFAAVSAGKAATQQETGLTLEHHADAYVLYASARRKMVFSKAQRRGEAVPLAAVADAVGRLLTLEYAGGRLATVRGPEGAALKFGWDGDRLARIERSAGGRPVPVRTFQYSTRGELAGVDAPGGRGPRFAYDGGLLVEVTLPGGLRQFAQYDAEGRCLALWDATAGATHFGYDGLRMTTRAVSPDGGQTLFQHVLGRQVLERVTPEGESQPYYYDEAGRLIGYAALDGSVAAFQRLDPATFELSQIGAEERVVLATYGAHGHLVSVSEAGGEAFALALDDHHQPAALTTPAGHVWRFGRDREGRVTEVTSPEGRVVRVRWDRHGRAVSDARGEVARVALDAEGRVEATTDAAGVRRQRTCDADGRLLSVAVPNGHSIAFTYDADGRLDSTADADGHRVRLGWDPAGRLAAVEQDGRRVSIERDAVGRVAALAEGSGRRVRLHRDASGRVVRVEAPGRPDTAYTYTDARVEARVGELVRTFSPAGDLLSKGAAGGPREEYTYGASGELRAWERTDPEGWWLFTYDADGLLAEIAGSPSPDLPSLALRVGFDGDGLLREVGGEHAAITLHHDPAGRLVGVELGEELWRIETDVLGRPLRITGAGGAVVEVRYDDLSRPVSAASGAETRDLRPPGATWQHTLAEGSEEAPGLMLQASRRGLVLWASVGEVRLPLAVVADLRAPSLCPSRALVLATLRGPDAVLGEPARGGPAALAHWTRLPRPDLDATALPCATALGTPPSVLDAFFLDPAVLDAHADREPWALPAHQADPARGGEPFTGPHATGPLRPVPWAERALGPRLAGPLVPLHGDLDPLDLVRLLLEGPR